jgi:hypothetical protein
VHVVAVLVDHQVVAVRMQNRTHQLAEINDGKSCN